MNRLLSFIRRKILRIPADRWDHQYAQGEWDGLPAESARLHAVISLIGSNYRTPAILEIGCGKAVMLRLMPGGSFSTFTGLDISHVAIRGARLYETERIRFVHADMQSFIPGNMYDVIAFNESLYYVKDPAAVFDRYLPYLKDGGSIIVSAFQNKYTAKLWPALARKWQATHIQTVMEGKHEWNIRMYRFEQPGVLGAG
jgi:2-polyprenyl-3-methyl-5-hydroxy-6-metoxy-1,4-benzoquinol methylase